MTELKQLLESDIQTQILDFLNMNGVFSFRVNSMGIFDKEKCIYRTPSKYSLKGTSDIIGIFPDGKFLAIEVKSAKGRPTKEQNAFINKINSRGGLAFICRSLESLKDILQKEGYYKKSRY